MPAAPRRSASAESNTARPVAAPGEAGRPAAMTSRGASGSMVGCSSWSSDAVARAQFDIVDKSSHRDFPDRDAVARRKRHVFAHEERIADLHPFRDDVIAASAIGVERKRDEGGAEGIIFDRFDFRRDIFLIIRKIDVAHAALVPAALVARCDAAESISATLALFGFHQLLVRLIAREKLPVRQRRHEAAALGVGAVRFDKYNFTQKDYARAMVSPVLRVNICLAAAGARRGALAVARLDA